MADEVYTATKRSQDKHEFAFMFSSLPDPSEPVVDGNDQGTVVDGNQT